MTTTNTSNESSAQDTRLRCATARQAGLTGVTEARTGTPAGGTTVNEDPRKGDWFLTFTGRKFWPLDPDPNEVCIEDIAHALSQICRFNGHTTSFYSVAQHSVIVSDNCPECALEGLMHDATEAYCGDLIRPIKYLMPLYRAAEQRIWVAIAQRFGLPTEQHPSVKVADNRALMTERRDLLVKSDHPWSLAKDFPPYPEMIMSWDPRVAYEEFMARFWRLTGARPHGAPSGAATTPGAPNPRGGTWVSPIGGAR